MQNNGLSCFGSNKLESIVYVYIDWLMYKLSNHEEDTMTIYKKETPEQLIIQNEIDCLKLLQRKRKVQFFFGRVYLSVVGFIRRVDKINYGLG